MEPDVVKPAGRTPIKLVRSLNNEEDSEEEDKTLTEEKRWKAILGINDQISEKDFTIMKALGQGSSGTVEKVLYKTGSKIMALKSITLNTSDDTFKKQLQIELQTLQRCKSNYVVGCFGTFLRDGKVAIMLEFMDLGSVESILKSNSNIPEVILGIIMYQVLKGLEYLHTKKLIHRDIKPSNLLINSNGEVKIADFGVSGVMEKTYGEMNSFVGTTIYMAPERIKGEKYSCDTDLWSLGLTIIEAITGKFPYTRPQASLGSVGLFDLMNSITEQPPPELPETCSADLKDFVKICLRKEKGTRTTATELLKHKWMKKFEGLSLDNFRKWLLSSS